MLDWIPAHKNQITVALEFVTAACVLVGHIGGWLALRQKKPRQGRQALRAELQELFSKPLMRGLDLVLLVLFIEIGWILWRTLPKEKWTELSAAIVAPVTGLAIMWAFLRDVEEKDKAFYRSGHFRDAMSALALGIAPFVIYVWFQDSQLLLVATDIILGPVFIVLLLIRRPWQMKTRNAWERLCRTGLGFLAATIVWVAASFLLLH